MSASPIPGYGKSRCKSGGISTLYMILFIAESVFIIEEAIHSLTPGTEELDLSGRGLTRLCHTQYLHSLTKLNLANNKLQTLAGVNDLQKLEILDVSGNQLTDISGADNMPTLGDILVSGNPCLPESLSDNRVKS